jgi:S1-C subfamily serine protease
MRLVKVLAIVISMSFACFGQSARDVARVAFKSVVLLEMNDTNGQPLCYGSGFFISKGIVATNAHVIDGASSGTAKLVGEKETLQILGTVAVDRNADLALLKVDSPAPSLILGPSMSPAVGDNVYVVGNPFGLEGTFSTGIISGIRHVGADSVLQMTAPISPGSSGGPVMDISGAVIGISVATFKDGQNLNIAVPVSYLSKLLASISEPVTVSTLGHLVHGSSSGKSIVDDLGIRAEAGVVASNIELRAKQYDTGTVFSMRLNNKLPVDVTDIRWRIIYYDASGSVMDYEDFNYGYIASGLATTVVYKDDPQIEREMLYYHTHGPKGEAITKFNNAVYNTDHCCPGKI